MNKVIILDKRDDFFFETQKEYLLRSLVDAKADFSIDFEFEDRECIEHIKNTYESESQKISSLGLPVTDLIILKGPGFFDGHAIRIQGKVYTFIDITAYKEYLKNKNFSFDVFFFHELVHGSHYSINVEFSPENIIDSDKRFLYKTIAEGMAVFISSKIYPQKDFFWFNFIDKTLCEKWLTNVQGQYEQDVKSLVTNTFSKEQRLNLLGLEAFNEKYIVNGRRSYFIGYKILNDYFDDHNPIDILNLKYLEIKNKLQ